MPGWVRVWEQIMRNTVSNKSLSSSRTGACFGAILTVCGMVAVSATPSMAADCRGDAAASIDWSQCNKRLLMLGGSTLDEANLSRTDFTYTDLRNSSFKSANFEKATLIRSSLASSALNGANLTKVEAYRSDFSEADMENAKFVSAEMQRTNFTSAKLIGTDFSKAELGRADFEGATLTGTKFTKANLSRARFEGASFEGPIDFEDSFLLLTRIEGLDLSAATGLQQEQIDLACGDDKTKLPQGLTAPATWPCAVDPDDD
jgi:uncharacterized protein YjbI with pentapeptide repeats